MFLVGFRTSTRENLLNVVRERESGPSLDKLCHKLRVELRIESLSEERDIGAIQSHGWKILVELKEGTGSGIEVLTSCYLQIFNMHQKGA